MFPLTFCGLCAQKFWCQIQKKRDNKVVALGNPSKPSGCSNHVLNCFIFVLNFGVCALFWK